MGWGGVWLGPPRRLCAIGLGTREGRPCSRAVRWWICFGRDLEVPRECVRPDASGFGGQERAESEAPFGSWSCVCGSCDWELISSPRHSAQKRKRRGLTMKSWKSTNIWRAEGAEQGLRGGRRGRRKIRGNRECEQPARSLLCSQLSFIASDLPRGCEQAATWLWVSYHGRGAGCSHLLFQSWEILKARFEPRLL